MATDATGTPTAKGIRKYNPDADAPSGLGFNGAMDDIDALLDKAQYSTDTKGTNKVPVWNGSAWVYSQITTGMIEAGAVDQTVVSFPGTAYTPTWTASGTAPALGNGSIAGKYIQIGKLVVVRFSWQAGSTTTFGTGTYSFSLPVTADGGAFYGSGKVVDSSAALSYGETAEIASANSFVMHYPSSGAANSLVQNGAASPFTWASGDQMFATLTYMAA